MHWIALAAGCGTATPETVYVEYCPVDTSSPDTAGPDDTGDSADTGDSSEGTDTGDSGDSGNPDDTDAIDLCVDRVPKVLALSGSQSESALWCPQDTIVLKGAVSFVEGTELVVAEGTRITGTTEEGVAGSLVIEAGATIDAAGTEDAPIVMAPFSGDPELGELGGLEIYGRAPGRRYPDGDAADDSGRVRYWRIEGGGLDQAVRLDSVGSGTEFAYVSLTRALDDGFELAGGTVEAHHLVVLDCEDDAVQYEDGFQGVVHDLWVARANGSAISARNRDPGAGGGNEDEPRSDAVVYGITVNEAYDGGVAYGDGALGESHNVILEDGHSCAFQVDDATWDAGGDAGIVIVGAIVGEADETFCSETGSSATLEDNASAWVVADPQLDGHLPDAGGPAFDPAWVDEAYGSYVGAFGTEDWAGSWAMP